jgi:hypothetical protein
MNSVIQGTCECRGLLGYGHLQAANAKDCKPMVSLARSLKRYLTLLTSDEHLAVRLPRLFHRPIFLNLLGIFVLKIVKDQKKSQKRPTDRFTMSDGRLTALHALPPFTSPANDI